MGATHLLPLFEAALRSLRSEDRRLARTFAHGVRQRQKRNQGLAYWVYETGLVYEVFKAWLPLREVYWEVSYPRRGASSKGSSWKADLVVHEDGKAAVVVEAKWWMSNQKKVTEYLKADVRKLRNWRKPVRDLVLLGFWWSPSGRWEKDLSEVCKFCSQLPVHMKPTPVFAGRFPTKVADGTPSYFAMTALVVPPPYRGAGHRRRS